MFHDHKGSLALYNILVFFSSLGEQPESIKPIVDPSSVQQRSGVLPDQTQGYHMRREIVTLALAYIFWPSILEGDLSRASLLPYSSLKESCKREKKKGREKRESPFYPSGNE